MKRVDIVLVISREPTEMHWGICGTASTLAEGPQPAFPYRTWLGCRLRKLEGVADLSIIVLTSSVFFCLQTQIPQLLTFLRGAGRTSSSNFQLEQIDVFHTQGLSQTQNFGLRAELSKVLPPSKAQRIRLLGRKDESGRYLFLTDYQQEKWLRIFSVTTSRSSLWWEWGVSR